MKKEGDHNVINLIPFQLPSGAYVQAVEVKLPKTNLLAISTEYGYIMCGALDVALLNERLASRQILAGRAVGVKSLDELLNAPLESVTAEAEARGIHPGMLGYQALELMRMP